VTPPDCSNVSCTRGSRKEAALPSYNPKCPFWRGRLVSRFGENHVKSTTWTPSTPQRAAWSRPTRRHRSARTSSPRWARISLILSLYLSSAPRGVLSVQLSRLFDAGGKRAAERLREYGKPAQQPTTVSATTLPTAIVAALGAQAVGTTRHVLASCGGPRFWREPLLLG
jgi:hypothetical protein